MCKSKKEDKRKEDERKEEIKEFEEICNPIFSTIDINNDIKNKGEGIKNVRKI